MKRGLLTVAALLATLLAGLGTAQAGTYADNFEAGTQLSWGNEVGSWVAAGGYYDASIPGNGDPGQNPTTYTSLPYSLQDFDITATMINAGDGGIWLRSSYSQATGISGVLLVVGGSATGFDGVYFHTFQNGSWSGPEAVVDDKFTLGDSLTVKVVVTGNTFTAYLNGTFMTSFTTDLFPAGQVALYDFGPGYVENDLKFDNIVLNGTPVPLPSAVWLMGIGLVGLIGRKRFRKG